MDGSRRNRLTIIATILGSAIVFLDATVVNVALPAISDDLDTGLSGQQWVVEAYLLALVSLLLVGGSLGDQFGRRRMFMLGLAGFAVTSLACAAAPSSGFLIAARAAQGFAGALLVPGSLAILAATFSGAERGRAVGTWTAWAGIATLIGPGAGGLLIETVGWRAVFAVNLPLVVVTLLLTHRAVAESKDEGADRAIDWVGIGLSAAGLGGPVFALIEQPSHGWSDAGVAIPLIGGLILFASFLAWESRYRHAMLDLSLFRIRNFWVTNLETLAVYAGLIGSTFFLTLFLQQASGYSALEAGLATTPISIVMFVLSPRFGRLASGTGPRLPMSLGPIAAGAAMLAFTRLGTESDYLTSVLPPLLLFGVGLAATVAPLTATVLDSVDQRHSGVASGINNGVSRVAGLLAIAIVGAVVAAGYASTLDDELRGQRLSAAAKGRVDAARQKPLTLAATDGLEPRQADRLSSASARAAEHGIHLGAGIGGVLMICGGVIGGIGIRNPRPILSDVTPRAAIAGDCGHSPSEGDRSAGAPEPAGAGAAA